MASRLAYPDRDRHVRRGGREYLVSFLKLLPLGIAWPRKRDSILVKTSRGLTNVWGYVDSRAADLLERESDPRKTIELLPDWEASWGLPDVCFPPGVRIEEQFGPTVLSNEWRYFSNVTLTPRTSPEFSSLLEDGTDGGHFARQDIPGLAAGEHRVAITWRSVGSDPRGVIVSVESTKTSSGANIWVNADGAVNVDETLAWGTGISIRKATNKVVDASGPITVWLAEFTVDVTIPGDFNLFGLYCVDGEASDYPGLDDGTGIEFKDQSLRTVTEVTTPITQSVAERQKMLVLYMTWPGYSMVDGVLVDWRNSTQSRDYFIWLMKFIGYEVEDGYIGEFAPFMAGVSQVGETRPLKADGTLDTAKNFRWYIGPPEQRFAWYVNIGSRAYHWFRAGSGQAGVDPHLRIGVPEDVQCLLNRWKPAQTALVMNFSDSGTSDPMAGTP